MSAPGALLLLAGSVFGCAATVPDHWPEPPGPHPHLAVAESHASPGGEEKSHTDHQHAASLFLGGALRRGDGGAATIGVDYEYILSERWGVGGFADLAIGSRTAVVLGGAGYWHPWKELVIVMGPGVEFEHGESNPLVRLGGIYELEVGKKSIAPAVFVDIIRDKKPDLVLGLNFIWKW